MLSWSTRPLRNEVFVHGTRGSLHIDCFLQTCTVSRPLPGPKAITVSLAAAAEAVATLYKVPRNMIRFATGALRPSPGIHRGVRLFHEALERGVPPPVTMEEGRRIVGWLDPICRRADADRDRVLRVAVPVVPATTLVTGASGFLGRALLEKLRGRGERIRVLVRRPSADLENAPDVEVVYGDLGDPETVERAVAGVERVYHLGATMRGRGWADFQAGTVEGTANVVRSCLKHGVARLVHVSSLTVLDYASQKAAARITEDAAVEPRPQQRGSYTQSKLQAETLVLEAIRTQGLQAVVLRPGQIFGPGAEAIPPYGTIALGGRWMVVGSGALNLPLVYVDDVADAVIAAGTRPGVTGSIFHLVDDVPVSQRDYIAMYRNAARAPVQAWYAPRSALFAAGSALEGIGLVLRRNVPLNRYRVQSIKELIFDCSAARTQLAWRPSVGVRDGLARTFAPRAQPTPTVVAT